MKKIITIGILFVITVMMFCACEDDTVTYYRDYNGNGRCDFGEEVYYEDSSGTHFFD